MSSESVPVPVPDTVVPGGIADPVELARAELKAALAAIEQKANVPRRTAEAAQRCAVRARALSRTQPVLVAAAVVGVAVAVGAAVWGAVRLYTR